MWRQTAINIFTIVRILIGCLFIVSGFEKLSSSYQNFLYVVQSYEFLPTLLEDSVARIVPWVELFLGVFLLSGLWIKWVLRGLMLLVTMFIIIVSQALIRNLPIEECGCFGGLVSFPLHVVLLVDSMLLMLTGLLFKNSQRTSVLSLDRYFG